MMDIPAFLAGQLASQYDEADVRRILSGYGVQRRTTLRVNRLRTNADAVRAALAEAGIGAEPVAWRSSLQRGRRKHLPAWRCTAGARSMCRASLP